VLRDLPGPPTRDLLGGDLPQTGSEAVNGEELTATPEIRPEPVLLGRALDDTADLRDRVSGAREDEPCLAPNDLERTAARVDEGDAARPHELGNADPEVLVDHPVQAVAVPRDDGRELGP
jgi:hypothetical protein